MGKKKGKGGGNKISKSSSGKRRMARASKALRRIMRKVSLLGPPHKRRTARAGTAAGITTGILLGSRSTLTFSRPLLTRDERPRRRDGVVAPISI